MHVDAVVARVLDVLLAFPTLLFALALLAIFNQSPSFLGMSGQTLNFAVLIFVLGFFGFAYLARIVRGQVLSLREKEFVDAARSLGASDWRIITREILPNLMGPVLVWATLTIPTYILGEAGLSFLGVGRAAADRVLGADAVGRGAVLPERPDVPGMAGHGVVLDRAFFQPVRRRLA